MSSSGRPSVRLAAVSLDAVDPLPEAEFWRDLLGLQIIWQNDDFVALRGAAVLITVQRVADHRVRSGPLGRFPSSCTLSSRSLILMTVSRPPLPWGLLEPLYNRSRIAGEC